ncbi:DUF378 domain-containing protein [Halobacterium wangiae]|uniref:DUF378 domain-containing protein n=1 Tax=Halobacterium wangiae TaxID=2902623 RepID=UPI001E49F7ED|nr:DUF378 domain-containing protein [Halobacterium wangiae]
MAGTRLSALDWVCFALLIIGALNWGVIGIADVNVVELGLEPVFQPDAAEVIARVIYAIVGLAGLYFFYPLFRVFRQSRRT